MIQNRWGLVRRCLTQRPPLLTMLLMVVVGSAPRLQAQGTVRSLRPDIQVRHILDTGAAPASVRLAQDPRTNTLFYLKHTGDLYRVNLSDATSTRLYTTTHHTVRNTQGFAIGPDGTMYLVGNEDRPNAQTRATIVKGVLDAHGNRVWSTLARTADYPKSNTAYDHRFIARCTDI
jgi:hypothetical protein